jgi:hypothetical protein
MEHRLHPFFLYSDRIIIRSYLKDTFMCHREEPPRIHSKGDEAICAVDVLIIYLFAQIVPLLGFRQGGIRKAERRQSFCRQLFTTWRHTAM